MSIRASLATQFRERRAVFSDRISARGHGHEFVEWIPGHLSIAKAVRDTCQALVIAQAAMDAGVPDAEKQVNRLRGDLGSWRSKLHDPANYSTPDIFMSVARALLPPELFDALLAQMRFVREEEARTMIEQIDGAMGKAKDIPPAVRLANTHDRARRRRESY